MAAAIGILLGLVPLILAIGFASAEMSAHPSPESQAKWAERYWRKALKSSRGSPQESAVAKHYEAAKERLQTLRAARKGQSLSGLTTRLP